MSRIAPVVVTVDVEDFFEPRPPFDTYRAVRDGKGFGAPLIMDLLEGHGGRGTFFVDVYNRRTVTEEIIAETVREIAARGHEVGLHTHPAFPEGRRGYGMARTMKTLSLDEQTEFVEKGVSLIRDWTGRQPVSHRAGGYGANYDTLRALAASGVKIDSSVFHGYPYCDLNDPPLTVNLPVEWGGVLEVPVTVTRSELKAGAFTLLAMSKKLDPDWCSPGEIRRQIDAVMATQQTPIILFLHSYSLVDIEGDFSPRTAAIRDLDEILAYIRKSGAELLTLEEAAKNIVPATAGSLHPAPIVQSDLVLRHHEQTFWTLRKLRLRHFKIGFDLLRRNRASSASRDT